MQGEFWARAELRAGPGLGAAGLFREALGLGWEELAGLQEAASGSISRFSAGDLGMSGLFLGKPEEQGGGGSGPALRRALPFFISALSPTGQTRQGQRRQPLLSLRLPPSAANAPELRLLQHPRPRSRHPFFTRTPQLHRPARVPWASLRAVAPPTPKPGPASPGPCVRRPLVVKRAHGPGGEVGAAGSRRGLRVMEALLRGQEVRIQA